MTQKIVLLTEENDEAIESLAFYSPAVPRVGEVISIRQEDRDITLKVLYVAYDFARMASDATGSNYENVEISIGVEKGL